MTLGQKVTIRAHVEREFAWFEPWSGYRAAGKAVKRYEKAETGVVVGLRTLKEGWTECDDEGAHFKPTRHVRVYLVAVNLSTLRRVLPEDVVFEEVSA